MPRTNNKYTAPTWVNGQAPAIDASELQAMSDTILSNQDNKADTVELNKTNKRVTNIESLLKGESFNYVTDSDVKYTKSIATGTQPYGTLNSLSGNTEVWNQLAQNGTFESTSGWTTADTISASGNVLTLTVSQMSSNHYVVSNSAIYIPYVSGHKYFWSVKGKASRSAAWSIYFDGVSVMATTISTSWSTQSGILTSGGYVTSNNILPFYCSSEGMQVGDTVQLRDVYCVDLTLRYGAGNEPTSTSDERIVQLIRDLADNPTYDAGSLVSATVDKLVSVGASPSTFTSEYPIPSVIQSLDGYGRSAGSVRNEVNFETKKYIKRVGVVDLGTLDWEYNSARSTFASWHALRLMKDPTNNMVCSKYTTLSAGYETSHTEDKSIWMWSTVYGLIVKDTSYTSAATFKTAMSGVMLYYELATPTETDISSIVPTDLFVNVEAEGTITAHNTSGKGVASGSSETYMVKL